MYCCNKKRVERWECLHDFLSISIETYANIESDSFIRDDAIRMWPSSSRFIAERLGIQTTIRAIHFDWRISAKLRL